MFCVSYFTVLWAAKGAFMAMLHGLGKSLSRPMQLAVWVGIIYMSLTYAIMIISLLAWCRPLSTFW